MCVPTVKRVGQRENVSCGVWIFGSKTGRKVCDPVSVGASYATTLE
jgi:hypothetical protein